MGKTKKLTSQLSQLNADGMAPQLPKQYGIYTMRGQTIVEYVIIIGIAITALYAMGPAFKRGTQSLIKATSDQLATQQNAEQDFSPGSGYLVVSDSQIKANSQRNVKELSYTTSTSVNETTQTGTNTLTDMGFSQ